MSNMVGVSGGVQVRRVAVHAWPFMVDVFTVVGWGEAARFDHGGHVDGGGRVSP